MNSPFSSSILMINSKDEDHKPIGFNSNIISTLTINSTKHTNKSKTYRLTHLASRIR